MMEREIEKGREWGYIYREREGEGGKERKRDREREGGIESEGERERAMTRKISIIMQSLLFI